jgi:lipoate-protein ligase A
METTLGYQKYNLPDIEILNHPGDKFFHVWQPDKTYIVLGQSNKTESSVNIDAAQVDGISILKRPSGGESVILTPKNIVVAFLSNQEDYKKPLDFFKNSNQKIMRALEKWPGVKGLHQRGISDLSVDNIKIAGSAIYRSKDYLFYHCVINVAEEVSLIERYLKHPKREPDYRKGRKHSEFVTNLQNLGYQIDIPQLITHFETEFWD